MGLLQLTTNLKDLRYGEEPYVVKKEGDSKQGIGLEILRRVDDLSRITQMFVDKPGIKYLLHEAELNQVNVQNRIEKAQKEGKTTTGAILQQIGGTLKSTAQLVASTLAQVPVNGTGTHFIRGFRTDTFLLPEGGNTRSAFAQFFGAGGVEGAQYTLQGAPVPAFSTLNNPVIVQTTLTPGDGSSLVKGIPNNGYYEGDVRQIGGNPARTFSSDLTYIDQVANRSTDTSNVSKDASRRIKKESRVNLGDQGARNDFAKYSNRYWEVSATAGEVDRINALDILDQKVPGESEGRDLVKFRFHVMTPSETKILYFRAFLDSFDDSFGGQWNPVKYLGRAEDFQVYGGFSRKISLSFKVAAATRVEMRPLYRKLMYLSSATAPRYSTGKQFMQGTIIKVTVGDYIYELPGVLNNFSINWQTDYPWEIAMSEPEMEMDQDMQELPMVLDCKMDFTPIHTFSPETGLKKYFTAGVEKSSNDFTKDQVDPLRGKSFDMDRYPLGLDTGPEASPLYSPSPFDNQAIA